MHFLSAIVLISAASAAAATSMQRKSVMALSAIMEKREVCKSVPEPATCEKSCGLGNVQCIAFPHCYNPSAGESCCSDGKYCPAGTYCTDAGCCPNGSSLVDCSATISLSVIPPPAPEQTSSATSAAPAPSSYATTESTTSTTEVTSLYTPTATSTETPVYPTTTPTYPTTTVPASVPSVPVYNATASSNLTATITPPAQYTGSAARVSDHGVAYFGLGGLGLLLVLFG